MNEKELRAEHFARALSPELINVHVPIAVMWEFDALTKVKKEILGRLGCLACTSGFDIRFRGSRDFVVNPQGKVSEFIDAPGFVR
jgi:hypothetical protein